VLPHSGGEVRQKGTGEKKREHIPKHGLDQQNTENYRKKRRSIAEKNICERGDRIGGENHLGQRWGGDKSYRLLQVYHFPKEIPRWKGSSGKYEKKRWEVALRRWIIPSSPLRIITKGNKKKGLTPQKPATPGGTQFGKSYLKGPSKQKIERKIRRPGQRGPSTVAGTQEKGRSSGTTSGREEENEQITENHIRTLPVSTP